MAQSDQAIEQEIQRQIKKARSVAPREIALALAADNEDWRSYLPRIKSVAAAMTAAGALVLVRKKKVVSPDGLKGVYRLAAPENFSEEFPENTTGEPGGADG